MFWNMDETMSPIPSNPRFLFQLEEQVRSTDRWLNYVLHKARLGIEDWEIYCFTHGLPTRHVGSWLPDATLPLCGRQECQRLQEETWPRRLHDLQGKWPSMVEMECTTCANERRRRAQVLLDPESDGATRRYATFATAPYVHPFNQPKYHALICHAWQFAKTSGKQLFWCLA